MIQIHKRPENEPQSWIEYRRTPGAEYAPSADLRDALIAEQGALCAYCMCRIPASHPGVNETSKIEHIVSRNDRSDWQLNYSNMVACCPGNTDGIPHCDKSKGNKSVTIGLMNDRLSDFVNYSSKEGTIKSPDRVWDTEMNEVLNLNHPRLKENRLAQINALVAAIKKKKNGTWDIQDALAKWTQAGADGKLRPYCGIVIWYLTKKQKQ